MSAFLSTPAFAVTNTTSRFTRFVSTNILPRTPPRNPLHLYTTRAMATIRIPPPAVNDRLKAESPPLYIDVRTPKEYADGHVPSALNVPVTLGAGVVVPTFVDDVKAVMSDRSLILGCKSGKRSSMAIDLLEKAGFKDLTEMEGGFDAWAAADLPVDR